MWKCRNYSPEMRELRREVGEWCNGNIEMVFGSWLFVPGFVVIVFGKR